jgi:hypothetical protein
MMMPQQNVTSNIPQSHPVRPIKRRRFERVAGFNYEMIISKYEHATLGMQFHKWIRSHLYRTAPLNTNAVVSRSVPNATPVAPDLGIHIIGSSQNFVSISSKVIRDMRNGSQLVWVIVPEDQAIIIYSRKGMRMLGIDDVLDGGEVIPGFMITVREVMQWA